MIGRRMAVDPDALDGSPVLSTAQMREAEAEAAPDPDAQFALMVRAGAGVAETVWRLSAGAEILIACGPGNNGGDGYIAARLLRERGAKVRVCAWSPPSTELANRAAAQWPGRVGMMLGCIGAPVFVDAMFGTGLNRKIDRPTTIWLCKFAEEARRHVAVDLPSGRDANGIDIWADIDVMPPSPDLTLALGALKIVHVLPSAPLNCGEVKLIDLGLGLRRSKVRTLARPVMFDPDAASHKYSRGMVGVIAGPMPGAAVLAATAAARAGAGYVAVYGDAPRSPSAIIHKPLTKEALADDRLDAIVIGPGLGRDDAAREWLDFVWNELPYKPLVVDADALHLLDLKHLPPRGAVAILTPHAAEMYFLNKAHGIVTDPDADWIEAGWSKYHQLTEHGQSIVLVEKGPTTRITGHDRMLVSPRGNPWLSTAGTGDVLAGAIAAAVATMKGSVSPTESPAAGVWLHAEAARLLGKSFIADDLAAALGTARGLM